MEEFHGYEMLEEWHNRGGSLIAKGKKDDKLWFIKRYRITVMPLDDGTLSPETLKQSRELFRRFVDRRSRVNRELREVAPLGGNVIIPREEFVEGTEYCEVSEYVDGAVPKDALAETFRRMTPEERLLVMKTAAAALGSVHGRHLVHSDLKPENLMLIKKAGGPYVAKLIDFDGSYFTDDRPRSVGGTVEYFSPEQGTYSKFEGEDKKRAELAKTLTEKSDIFSLGLWFHFCLTGTLPEPVNLTEKLQQRKDKGKVVYCWIALTNGCSLKLSPDVGDDRLSALIGDMLAADPARRPDAGTVLDRLNADAVKPGYCEPWPEHGVFFDKDRLAAKKVVGVARNESDGQKSYLFLYADGRTRPATLRSMLNARFARPGAAGPVGGGGPAPGTYEVRPEDGIMDEAAMQKRGFMSAAPAVESGVPGYRLSQKDGEEIFLPLSTMRMLRLVNKPKKAESKEGGG